MKASYRSDTGRVRLNNEDALLVDEDLGIFLLADGMGGHNAGEVASALAVREAHAFLQQQLHGDAAPATCSAALAEAMRRAHAAVRKKADGDGSLAGMGTTLMELALRQDRAYICHVGDCRAYLLRSDLRRLTHDHRLGAGDLSNGIPANSHASLRMQHVLTQAVGGSCEEPVPESLVVEVRSGDVILLCTDGLTDMLPDDEIARIMTSQKSGLSAMVDELTAEALNRGGKDNISLIAVSL